MKIYDMNIDVQHGQEPIFFGSGKNIQRYDMLKYPVFDRIGDDMREQFWSKTEISLLDDYVSFKTLSEAERRLSIKNISRQSMLDSVQGRALLSTIGRVLTNSELEKALTILQEQEIHHSDTYTHILRNVLEDPAEIFDDILKDRVITEHTVEVTKLYEELYVAISIYEAYQTSPYLFSTDTIDSKYLDIKYLKRLIYLTIVSWNILEGLRFFVSFACTFALAEAGKMIGNAQELKLIARDELTHLRLSQSLLRILRTEECEGFLETVKECEDEVKEMFIKASEDEIDWATYLFNNGSVVGLNTNNLTAYIKYITNVRCRAIGVDQPYPKSECRDLPFMNNWLGVTRVEELPQEIDTSEYKIGITIDNTNWDLLNQTYS